MSGLCGRHGLGAGAEEEQTEGSNTEVVRQKEFLDKTVVTLKNQLNQVWD